MAEQGDPGELADLKEISIANMIEIQTIYQLLVDRGIITEQEYFSKLKQTRSQYRMKQ